MSIRRPRLSSDGYTMVPNHWLRDPRLSYKAKGLLAAIASHDEGYALTIRQLIAQSRDKRAAVDSALEELEELGYLRRARAARGGDGKWGSYDWDLVESPPAPPNVSAGDDQCGKSALAPVRKISTGHDQQEQGVSAGDDQCGFPAAGNPHLRRTEGEDQEEDHPPQPPADAAASAVELAATREGEGLDTGVNLAPVPAAPLRAVPDLGPEMSPGMAAAVAAVREHQPGWRPAAVRDALEQAVAARCDPGMTDRAVRELHELAVTALVALARGDYPPRTVSPRRLLEDGPWWLAKPVRGVTAVAGPRCGRHPGQPADNCGGCRGEELAAEDHVGGASATVADEQGRPGGALPNAAFRTARAALRPSLTTRERLAQQRAATEPRDDAAGMPPPAVPPEEAPPATAAGSQ